MSIEPFAAYVFVLDWRSKKGFVDMLLSVVVGMVVGVIGGRFGKAVGSQTTGLSQGLINGLAMGMLLLLITGLRQDKQSTQIRQPNQAIWKSLQNGLIGALGMSLFWALALSMFTISPRDVISSSLLFGLIIGSSSGWVAVAGHLALRILCYWSKVMPLNYARFLDYAAERIFLRKVGGGYLFVHGLLRDYFADRYAETMQRIEP